MTRYYASGRWFDHLIIVGTVLIFLLGLFGGVRKLGPDDSKVIRIVTALLPPQMDGDGRGREAEIIEAALRAGDVEPGIRIEFHVLPFTRHWHAFKADGQSNNRYDAVTTVPDEISLGGLRSERYIQYQNGIIYRAESYPQGLPEAALDALNALAKKRIVAFAGAAVVVGEMRKVSEQALIYLERRDQLSHSIMFTGGTVDIVVAEELIFAHYTRQVLGAAFGQFAPKAVFDPVFCPTYYRLVFRSERYRDAFNAGLMRIRSNGTLRKILSKYAAESGISKVSRSKQIGGCQENGHGS